MWVSARPMCPRNTGAWNSTKSPPLLFPRNSRDGAWAATLGAQAGIGLPIAFFGTEAQKTKYVPKIASAEWVGAYCLSEATSASDALNAKTRAVLSEDGKRSHPERH